MGGVDKGLQLLRGRPMVQHALERLRPQVGPMLVNANRNLPVYEALGVPVVPDALPDFGGPLTGFLAGLERCTTPWLVTVPCDTPFFPVDLVARLGAAAQAQQAEVAMASGMEDGAERTQPVFCLLRATLLPSLREFIQAGGRKIDAWTARHRTAIVCFGASAESTFPFVNVNTLDQLHQLEQP